MIKINYFLFKILLKIINFNNLLFTVKNLFYYDIYNIFYEFIDT